MFTANITEVERTRSLRAIDATLARGVRRNAVAQGHVNGPSFELSQRAGFFELWKQHADACVALTPAQTVL
jgi:hypothetical protein